MSDRVRIADVCPRDGLQNEPGFVPTAEKVRLIELLSGSGVDEVELTSFVSPKWVPQLSDAGDVVSAIGDFAAGVRYVSSGLTRGRAGDDDGAGGGAGGLPMFSVLVPNMAGFERAAEAAEAGFGELKVAVVAAASETFSQKNLNASIDETADRLAPVFEAAGGAGMPVRVYVSCAVSCPFEGPIAPERVAAVADRLLGLCPASGPRAELDLADTIGVATPDDVAALLGAIDPGLLPRTTLHLHDTHGRARACVGTALEMGVRSFDGSAGGLGGCPFAAAHAGERAPGNIATEALVRAVHDAGYTTGVDLDLLSEASACARRLAERARAEPGGGGAGP